ncbi:MAG: sulfatase-like hydrolase/transferase [Candidatus Altiarchaeales archaeon]|nr:sulfatase-like hydrolase/transferase [Candidatus Altiarchaeales archaeon]
MNKQKKLIPLVFMLFLLAYLLHQNTVQSRPNLIILSLDTLRGDSVGYMGYVRNTSPALDEVAEHAYIYTKAFSHAPRTTPSHITLFTSLYPSQHLVPEYSSWNQSYALSPEATTLTQLLNRSGYRCAAFTGGGNVAPETGLGRGFHAYETCDFPCYLPRLSSFISENEGNPFFLFIHTYEIHSPYTPPESYVNYFGSDYGGGITVNKTLLMFEAEKQEKSIHDVYFSYVDRENEQDIFRLKQLYDAEIRYSSDVLVSRLIGELREHGLYENTLLIITSDHGEEFMEHGGLEHWRLYNEHIHVPLIIKLPYQRKQKKVKQYVGLIDVAPTVLDYLDISTPGSMQGVNLLEVNESFNRPLFSERITNLDAECLFQKAMIHPPHKYVWCPLTGYEKVYDLSKDPGELNPNSGVGARRLVELRRAFFDWMNHTLHTSLPPTKLMQPSPQTRERLRKLGYLN